MQTEREEKRGAQREEEVEKKSILDTNDFDIHVGVQEQIFRFEITMATLLGVAVLYS